jgi:hypothetical protein
MTISAIFRAPERCLCLALTMVCLGIMAVLPYASAVSALDRRAVVILRVDRNYSEALHVLP